jgi:hypothetical protein
MNQNQVQELIMGAALVALSYALYKHFKPGANKSPTSTPAPYSPLATTYGPTVGAPYDVNSPAGYMKLVDLLKGTVGDIGSYNGQNYLMTPDDPWNNGGRDSVFLPGAPW